MEQYLVLIGGHGQDPDDFNQGSSSKPNKGKGPNKPKDPFLFSSEHKKDLDKKRKAEDTLEHTKEKKIKSEFDEKNNEDTLGSKYFKLKNEDTETNLMDVPAHREISPETKLEGKGKGKAVSGETNLGVGTNIYSIPAYRETNPENSIEDKKSLGEDNKSFMWSLQKHVETQDIGLNEANFRKMQNAANKFQSSLYLPKKQENIYEKELSLQDIKDNDNRRLETFNIKYKDEINELENKELTKETIKAFIDLADKKLEFIKGDDSSSTWMKKSSKQVESEAYKEIIAEKIKFTNKLKELEKKAEIEQKILQKRENRLKEVLSNPEYGAGNIERMLDDDYDFYASEENQ